MCFMKGLVILLTLFLIPIISYAQNDTLNKSWNVYITPTSILNPLYPALHFGVEKELGKWSALMELGVLSPSSLYKNSTSALGLQDFAAKNKGFFIKIEGKRYLNKYLYTGLNIQLLRNDYERTDTFDETPELTAQANGFWFCTTCVEDTYRIKKTMIGTSLKIGVKVDLPKNLFLDGYFGLGLSYHMNTHSKNTELHKNPAIADGLIGYYDVHYPGDYVFHLPAPILGIRFGYRIP